MADGSVAGYYDRLHRWNTIADRLGYGGGRRDLTVHRRLADPRLGGHPSTTRLHDVVLDYVPSHPRRVLDAGCGLGGTMLALHDARGGEYVGVTLSASQADVANRSARERGVADHVAAVVQSYDEPPPGPFDLIVAIESLAHSANAATSVGAFARVLARGGRIIIVDDMPEPGARESADFATFAVGWQSPHVLSRAAYLDALRRLAFTIVADVDLTPHTRPRPMGRIAALMWLNRTVAACVPSTALRQVLRSHLGGLALERLTRRGLMRYRLIVADSPGDL